MAVNRKCDCCGESYEADSRNLKRGWGLCCSKSCASKMRELRKSHQFDPLAYKELNDHLTSEHGLLLVESELEEIINIVKNMKLW